MGVEIVRQFISGDPPMAGPDILIWIAQALAIVLFNRLTIGIENLRYE